MLKDKDVLTIPEAAKYCAVDRVTLWRWVKSGNLNASITPGGHHRILKEDLEAFLVDRGMYPLAHRHFSRNRVLIVDDDPEVQKAIEKPLLSQGYNIEVASDGFEAGVKVMQFRPHLIVLDMIMEGMDGLDVCRLIKKDQTISYIKILALAEYDADEHQREIVDAGADSYLVKPVHEDVLINQIENLLHGQ